MVVGREIYKPAHMLATVNLSFFREGMGATLLRNGFMFID